MEEKNRCTEGKINSLEAENKELHYIIQEQAEKMNALLSGVKDSTPRVEPRTPTPAPLPTRIPPATPHWPKLMQMRKSVEATVNPNIAAETLKILKAPASYV